MNSITKAQYEQAKAAFIATVKRLMAQHNLTSSDIQRSTAAEVMAARASASITMQDLYHYMQGHGLPRGEKLQALAKALKVAPSQLIPTEVQTARVRRRRDNVRRANSGHVDVLPMPSDDKALVRVQILCDPLLAHKIAAANYKVVVAIANWNNGVGNNEEQVERQGSGPFVPNEGDKANIIEMLEIELDAALEQDLQKIQ